MTVFTSANYDPVARMNAARDMHRAKGTTGGKGNAKLITDTDRHIRDAGLACHDIALATVDAIWSEFRSWSQNERSRPLGDCSYETEIPF